MLKVKEETFCKGIVLNILYYYVINICWKTVLVEFNQAVFPHWWIERQEKSLSTESWTSILNFHTKVNPKNVWWSNNKMTLDNVLILITLIDACIGYFGYSFQSSNLHIVIVLDWVWLGLVYVGCEIHLSGRSQTLWSGDRREKFRKHQSNDQYPHYTLFFAKLFKIPSIAVTKQELQGS